MATQEEMLERREEDIADLRHENLMTSDYEYFLEYNNGLLDDLRKLIEIHHRYGWYMTTDNILKEVNERL